MFLIFGLKRYLDRLASVVLTCSVCGTTGPNAIWRKRTKLSLFFVPVLTLRRSYSAQCGTCGSHRGLSGSEARRLTRT